MAKVNKRQKVYVIGPPSGPYKVGISHQPERRLYQLQNGNPNRLKIHLQVETDDAVSLEYIVHHRLANHRLSGEWFNSSLSEIEEAINRKDDEPDGSLEGGRITGRTFVGWLSAMRAVGDIQSDADAARLLRVTPNTIVAMKVNGADFRTAMACRALFHRLEPWE